MQTESRNLFRLSRFILLNFPVVFKFLAKFRKPQKRLLIVKTDAIGDYILFRNFIELVTSSERYKYHNIHLLGNVSWKDAALKYDGLFIHQFIFINAEELYQQPQKILRLGLRLFLNNYETVLQPSYTRRLITDGLAGLTGAAEKKAFYGDLEGINLKYKLKTDKFYNDLLILPADKYFEFERTKYFFENVLGCDLQIKKPSIGFDRMHLMSIVIFPGAGVLKRSWEKEKFMKLIKLVLTHTDLQVYIAGGNNESKTGDYIIGQLKSDRVTNLAGKTSLPQLIDLIGNASLVISNETSAVHIAAATETKAICISGGGHFNRFVPYPVQMEAKSYCVFHTMECFGCNWDCIHQTAKEDPYPCISVISVAAVWGEVLHELYNSHIASKQ